MININVPATSANLGVGYDCMGLALNEFATISFERIESGFHISGCIEEYCNEDNLIYKAFLEGLRYMREQVSGIHIHVSSTIPLARGLGSSATCVVAGIAGANALFSNRMNKYEIFEIATRMEGHPDNVAPAIFGSLCVSFMFEDKPNMIRYGTHRDLLFITMIPDYEVSTKEARKVLPTTLSYTDAIYQMGRCAAMAKALEIGNAMVIQNACQDKMQEPYRKQLIPEYDKVKRICKDAITMYISGSGSTMIAVSRSQEVADAIVKKITMTYPSWTSKVLKATYDGMRCEVV